MRTTAADEKLEMDTRGTNFRVLFRICLVLLTFVVGAIGQLASTAGLRLVVTTGHSDNVMSVAVSADGKLALTGSVDRTAILWELASGKQLQRFVGHQERVASVGFSPDSRYVITGSFDGSARLWETTSGKQVREFYEDRNGVHVGHVGKIYGVAISPDGRLAATAGEDGTARVWDLATAKQIHLLQHPAKVNGLAFSPDSRRLLTGSEDKVARLFSTEDGSLVRPFPPQSGAIISVAYSRDGTRVVTGSIGLAVLWDTETGQAVRIFDDIVGFWTYGVAISPDGNLVYAGGTVFDSANRKRIAIFGETGTDAVFTPDGSKLIAPWVDQLNLSNLVPAADLQETKRRDSRVFVYDLETRKEPLTLVGRSDGINQISVAPDFRSIFVAAPRGVAGFWNIEKGSHTNPFGADQAPFEIYSAGFSADGTWLVSKEDSSLTIRDGQTGARIARNNDCCWNRDIAISHDKRFIIGKSNNSTLVTIQSETLTTVRHLRRDWSEVLDPGPDAADSLWSNLITHFALSANDKLIAIAIDSGVGIWNVEDGAAVAPLKVIPVKEVHQLAFSPDEKWIATASGAPVGDETGGRFDVWDAKSGTRIDGFENESGNASNLYDGYRSLAFSSDAKFLAVGSFGGTVYVRNMVTRSLKRLKGHTDTVTSVRFAKDANGRLLLISSGADSTIRIWEAETGKEICSLVSFRDGSWAVVETGTGRYDASNGGDIDGITWIYGVETIALSQLKDLFYTPNLLPRLLGYSKEPFREVPNLGRLKLFPKVVNQTLDPVTTRLTVKLENRGGGIGAVRVLVNGKLATEDARDAKLRSNPDVSEAVVEFDLKGSAGWDPAGENVIEVITNNFDPSIGKGYISSRAERFVSKSPSSGPPKQPKLFAIIAGVSDYNGERLDLRFAAKDAEDFAHALGLGARRLFCPKENPRCVDKVKLTVLTTSQKDEKLLPTKKNIRAAFAEVAREAGPDDVLVVYLAGHGTSLHMDDADSYLFLTQVADSASRELLQVREYREAAAISSGELVNWMTQEKWIGEQKGIRARNQVMILDTCAAGAFEQKVSIQKPRDLSSDQITALEKLNDRTGLHILMGSAADAVSYEASQYGQGLLTFALLQGIKGAALRTNRIETQFLFDYAVNQVPIMASGIGGIQRPRVFGSTSIPIGLMEADDKAAIKLETVKPIVLRPNFVLVGETASDVLELTDQFQRLLIRASEARPLESTDRGPLLVFIDDTGFPGGIRVTGTYTTDAKGAVKLRAFLWKDRKIFKELDQLVAADASEASRLLLDEVVKSLK